MRVFPFKPECQTPIAIHADCIMALQFAAQFVKLPSCNIHVCRIFGHVKLAELPSQFFGMIRLYSRLAARLEKLFQPDVPEREDVPRVVESFQRRLGLCYYAATCVAAD